MYYIYEIKNNINYKTYIGQRKCPVNKIPETDIYYMGSGTYLANAKKKYGLQNFTKKVIAICETSQNADILEKVFISLYRAEGKAEYNMADGGVSHFTMSDEIKMKCSKIRKKYLQEHPEIREKISKANKGRKHTEEFKRKISEMNKGRKMSAEAIEKISKVNKGRKLSEETKEKMRQANLGKHLSEETKRKISESNKGKKMSKESIEKMKKNNKGSLGKHWNLSSETKKNQSESKKGISTKWVKNTYWFNNGKINIRCEVCPEGFVKGRLLSESSKNKMLSTLKMDGTSKGSKGMHWWNNGIENVLSYECPEGFISGKK